MSYRNQKSDWQCKSNDCFPYKMQYLGWNGLIHKVQCSMETIQPIANQLTGFYMLVKTAFSELTSGLKLQFSVFWLSSLLLISLCFFYFFLWCTFVMLYAIWYNFYNLRLQPATLLKVTLLRAHFSRFLNYKNGTKSGKASHTGNAWRWLSLTVSF